MPLSLPLPLPPPLASTAASAHRPGRHSEAARYVCIFAKGVELEGEQYRGRARGGLANCQPDDSDKDAAGEGEGREGEEESMRDSGGRM